MTANGARNRSASLALTRVGVGLVVALALGLRLAFLRHDSTFQRTDEVMLLLNAANLHGLVAPASLAGWFQETFWTFAFPWGYPVVLFLGLVLEVYGLLAIPVTEFTAVAPFAVLGGLASLLVYLLGAHLFSRPVGLASALALAVFPSHVAQSRTPAAWILAGDLLVLVVLLFVRYVERRRSRDAWLFSLALAIYLPSDNTAPGAVVLLLASALAVSQGPLLVRVAETWRLFWRREVLLLPALTVAPLMVVHVAFVVGGRATYGFIGHYLLGKAVPGVHLDALASALAANGGPAMAALIAAGALRGLVALVRRDRGLVVAVWMLAFGLPTAFLVNPAGTMIAGYVTPLIFPLLLLGAAAVGDVAAGLARRSVGSRIAVAPWLVFAAVVAWTLVTIPPRVYAVDFLGLRADPIGMWGGEVYPNNGAKTAAYWVRRETRPDALVVSDLRFLVGKYYFARRTVSLADLAGATGGARPDVLAITRPALAGLSLDAWHEAATVTHRGQEVFLIYTRAPRVTAVLPAEEFDGRFDREFGRIDRLRVDRIWGD